MLQIIKPGGSLSGEETAPGRLCDLLAEELKVVSLNEVPGRIFFISAKEVLCSRSQRAQGMPETGEPGEGQLGEEPPFFCSVNHRDV